MNKKLIGIIWLILFALYNIVLFVISGFAAGTATFWTSYAFVIVSFLVIGGSGLILGKTGMKLKDWLFGYPIVRHSTIYAISELVVSVLFMLMHELIVWQIAFVVQLLIVAVYLVFVVSCFISKNTIEELHETVKQKSTTIQLLRAEAEMLVAETNDANAKKIFASFAEQVRFSDPMSADGLQILEGQLIQKVADARAALKKGETDSAVALCEEARLLLLERNKKTLILK